MSQLPLRTPPANSATTFRRVARTEKVRTAKTVVRVVAKAREAKARPEAREVSEPAPPTAG